MTRLHGNMVSAGFAFIPIDVKFSDGGSTDLLGNPMTGPTSRNGGVDGYVPHLYASFALDEKWSVGLAVNAPFGLGTEYGSMWTGRYWATKSELKVFNVQPSVAWAATDKLSLGAGLNVIYSDGTLSNMIDFGSIGAALSVPGLSPQANDGSVSITGDDLSLGFTLGALYEFTDQTRAGVTFRSQVRQTLSGSADFFVPPEAAPLTNGGTVFQDTGAEVPLTLPPSVSASVYHAFDPRWAVVADVTWTRWSTFDAFVVRFDNPAQPTVTQAADWNDTWRFSVGCIFTPNEKWTFRVGAAYEQSAVPDRTREPRVPVEDRYWMTLGAGYAFSDKVVLDVAYLQWFSPDASINLSSPQQGTLVGSVDWFVASVGATLTIRF